MRAHILRFSASALLSTVCLMSVALASKLTIHNENIPIKVLIGTNEFTPILILIDEKYNTTTFELPAKNSTSENHQIQDVTFYSIKLAFRSTKDSQDVQGFVNCGNGNVAANEYNRLAATVSYGPGNPTFGGKCDISVTDLRKNKP